MFDRIIRYIESYVTVYDVWGILSKLCEARDSSASLFFYLIFDLQNGILKHMKINRRFRKEHLSEDGDDFYFSHQFFTGYSKDMFYSSIYHFFKKNGDVVSLVLHQDFEFVTETR